MNIINKKRLLYAVLSAFLVFLATFYFIYRSDETLSSGADSVNIKELLDLAILDEYKAQDFYQQIIEEHGEIRPFINIVNAEQKHITALENLYSKYDVPLPVYESRQFDVSVPVSDLCKEGVKAEIENAKLYEDTLIPGAGDYFDIVNVFTNNVNASRNNHLPAFERCATSL